MRPVEKLFREYEAFHKDPRNKLTHYFGITAIVLALVTALDVVALPGPSIGEMRTRAADSFTAPEFRHDNSASARQGSRSASM